MRYEAGRPDVFERSQWYETSERYWGAGCSVLPDGSIKVEDDGAVAGPSSSRQGRVLDIVTMDSDHDDDFAPMPLGGGGRHCAEISFHSSLSVERDILGARASGSGSYQGPSMRQPVAFDQLQPAGLECEQGPDEQRQDERVEDDFVREGEFLMDHYSKSNDYQFY